MDLEMSSMAKFGVFVRVPKSHARGHQILGNKWVYRRKIGKDGLVTRWRARLVAHGFRQRPFDSYQPDEYYSPVVGKDTLRLLLSIAAAKNLRLYSADVTAAFLQATLDQRIYMRCPDGYASSAADGEEEVLELRNAMAYISPRLPFGQCFTSISSAKASNLCSETLASSSRRFLGLALSIVQLMWMTLFMRPLRILKRLLSLRTFVSVLKSAKIRANRLSFFLAWE